MFQKLKQFKNMRDKAKVIHEKLSQEHVEGSAGFGKVKIMINGAQQIESVDIDENLIAPGNKNKLQDLIKDAANDAIQKCHKVMAEKMKDSMGDFQMPDLG